MEQAVLERRAGHLDAVGELEAALEGARRDALVEDVGLAAPRSLRSPRTERVFSFTSMVRSGSVKPATATEMR